MASNDFNKNTTVITKDVSLPSNTANLTLSVDLRSQPGAFITLTLYGTVDLGDLNDARYGHKAAALPDGKVLITGGKNDATVSGSAEVYDPGTRRFTKLNSSLNSPRYDHSSTVLPDSSVLQTGGKDAAGNISSIELFDRSTNLFNLLPQKLNTSRSR